MAGMCGTVLYQTSKGIHRYLPSDPQPKKKLNRSSHPNPKTGKTQTAPSNTAFVIGMAIDSITSVSSTNVRFTKQLETMYGRKITITVPEYFRGLQLYFPVRLAQFKIMAHAKTMGYSLSELNDPSASPTQHTAWGAGAATIMGIPFGLPLEKTLLDWFKSTETATQFSPWRAMGDNVRAMCRGQIKGLAPTFIRDLPYGASAVVLPSVISDKIRSVVPNGHISPDMINSAASLGSAVVFVATTQPADVAKTLIQSNASRSDAVIATIIDLIKSRGVTALFSGATSRIYKNFMTFFIYNTLVQKIDALIDNRL